MEVKFCPYCGWHTIEKIGMDNYKCEKCEVIIRIEIEAEAKHSK